MNNAQKASMPGEKDITTQTPNFDNNPISELDKMVERFGGDSKYEEFHSILVEQSWSVGIL